MGKKNRNKNKTKSPARQRPDATATTTAPPTTTTAAAKPVPSSITRPAPIVPKEDPSLAPTTATAPVSVSDTAANTTNTNTNSMMEDNDDEAIFITLDHLNIIHKYGSANGVVDQQTAVVDMHQALKSAPHGGLAKLTSSQYAARFQPLKEALWFGRRGSFEVPQDWTLCKTYATVTTRAAALTTNLALLDLEGLPGDDTPTSSLLGWGNTLGDETANAWFHTTLEALYDLVAMDSDIRVDAARRDELLRRVASFVHQGSTEVLTATTQASTVTTDVATPPPLSFGMILQVYLKLKGMGGHATTATPDANDWTQWGLTAADGPLLWKSLQERAQLDLPRQVWWKVLLVLVLELEPHLLRMNLTLVDSPAVRTFQDFLDECMEPPDQAKNKFYKQMMQQVYSLQNVCLLTSPPRVGPAMDNLIDVLKQTFVSGEQTVYNPHVVDDIATGEAPAPAPAPTPAPIPAAIEAPVDAPEDAPAKDVKAPASDKPSDPPAPAPEVSHAAAAPEVRNNDAPAPVPAVDADGPNLAPSQKRLSASSKTEPAADADKKPPMPVIRTVAKPTSSRPPRAAPPSLLGIEINANHNINPGRATSDNYSLAGSITELNKEEALLDLMHQAAAMCDVITTEKQVLLTRERRMGRNLRSCEDNLQGLEAINKQLMKENNNQKEEIYKREDDINKLHVEAKHAARELSSLDTLNSQLQEQIENLTKAVDTLKGEKKDLQEQLETATATGDSLEDALEVAKLEAETLKAKIASEQAAKAAVEHDLSEMQTDKDMVELKLKGMVEDLEAANDEIDRLEDIQAEQQRVEAEARKAAMEARRREFEAAERDAAESLKKAEDMRAAKAAARRRGSRSSRA